MPILNTPLAKTKKYVYLVTDRNRSCLHVGMSTDLMKTMTFYRQMPNLFFDSGHQLTRLVYFEELSSENSAVQRFNLISKFTRIQKDRMIRSVNPDWIDLTVGLDFEQILRSGIQPVNKMAPTYS
ncbi:GIY-YIG nuclease family protein [Daejeonella lutea]|uniref:Putative endonuclease n=1 Tax=Daejeonella lutea TaxID=572036 RepID=A0A1T5B3W9_9SPHI|nr:GIY-YIG nuclease family protein [Daejeonella lutea]SKB41958.1 putative endonuclease [Daejeonella lutea]